MVKSVKSDRVTKPADIGMLVTSQSTIQSVYDLVDGQVRQEDLARVVALVCSDGDARAEWKVQQLVGETMRRGAQLAVPAQPDLSRRVLAGIASGGLEAPEGALAQAQVPVKSTREAANNPWFDWRMVAGIAVFAVVGSVAWLTLSANPSGSGSQLVQQNLQPVAKASAGSTLVASEASANPAGTASNGAVPSVPVMIRDPHLDALMAAHKQFGGTSALQKPAGFVRNATFEGPAR